MFPDLLKYPHIMPVFKKKEILQKFKMIDLYLFFPPPAISKVFEKASLKGLSYFIESNILLHDSQFGFHRGKMIKSAFFHFFSKLFSNVEGSHSAVGVLCDISKAFNSVNHELFISK